jgi:hypothetical protein
MTSSHKAFSTFVERQVFSTFVEREAFSTFVEREPFRRASVARLKARRGPALPKSLALGERVAHRITIGD